MPGCRIDADASRKFQHLVKQLTKKYPRLLHDLQDAFSAIERDYMRAAHASAIPGFGRTVWKYRWKSSDLQRGESGGIRIIALYDEQRNTLYPLFVYFKVQQEDVSTEAIMKAITELKEALEAADRNAQPEIPPEHAQE